MQTTFLQLNSTGVDTILTCPHLPDITTMEDIIRHVNNLAAQDQLDLPLTISTGFDSTGQLLNELILDVNHFDFVTSN